jgi:oxalate decarboxylase/phosphoglucose isomerase-like protein (cupin superfamily)
MGTFTRDTTELAFEADGLGEQYRGEGGGMVVALERWKAGLDTAEMFADFPDGACQEPHWGYMVGGQVTIRYTDGRTMTLSAGQAYHIEPGHNAHVDEDAEIVEFSRTDQGAGVNDLTN